MLRFLQICLVALCRCPLRAFATLFITVSAITFSGIVDIRATLAQDQPTQIDNTTDSPAHNSIVVGSKEYTEQLILGQMLVILLEHAGYDIVDKTGLGGSPVVRNALETGEIDLYPELTGTALSVYYELPSGGLPADPDRAYTLIKALDKSKDIIWLDRGYFNNTYTMMINQNLRVQGIETLEDLADYMQGNPDLTVCIETEFYGRLQDGLHGMENQYDFSFTPENIQVMELDETYDALRDGRCDVAEGFSTDGRINAWNFHNLIDTQSFFPFYNIAPVTRQDVLNRHPGLTDVLNQLGRHLNNEAMSALNARVDIGSDGAIGSGDEESVKDVAKDFLLQQGLLLPKQIIVGSKEYTEQLILGKILYLLLENAGYPVSDRTGIGGSTVVRRALEEGEIDLYFELTGTALSVYYGIPAVAVPKDPERSYELIKSLDLPLGMVWLGRGDYNNTYTLMVKPELYASGLESIEDLADFMNANDAPFTLCVESEFYARQQDGLHGMEQEYQFAFRPENILVMDLDQNYDSLRDGTCDVAEGYSTDGRISAWGFHNLEDTRVFFPFYNPAPVVRQAVLETHPELADILGQIGPYLDNQTISTLNARVDIGLDGLLGSGDEEAVEDVARDFLQKAGLIKNPVITIGSKKYTEQLILGQMYIHILRDAGYEVVDMTGLGGSPMVRSALVNGEIDLYPEFNGTALSVYHELSGDSFPETPELMSELARILDEPYGFIWLRPGLYNNTYTLMVQQSMVDNGISTIEDLANFMNENDAPFTLCTASEFFSHQQDGLNGLQERYGFRFKEPNISVMDSDAIYEALREGRCDVAEGFSTDGRIEAWGFYNLEDTLSYFPFYNISPVIRQDVLSRHNNIADLLNRLGSLLDDSTMSRLNALVDIGLDGVIGSGDEERPDMTAKNFLCLNGLLENCDEFIEIGLNGAESIDSNRNADLVDGIAPTLIQNGVNDVPTDSVIDTSAITSTATQTSIQTAVANSDDTTDTIVDVLTDTLSKNELDAIEDLVSSLTIPSLSSIPLPEAPPTATMPIVLAPIVLAPIVPASSTPTPILIPTLTPVPSVTPIPTLNLVPSVTPSPIPSAIPSAVQLPTPTATTIRVNVIVPVGYSVNARDTADLRGNISGVLPRGAILHAIGRTADGKWLRIVLPTNNQTAWVFKDAVFFQPAEVALLPVIATPVLAE